MGRSSVQQAAITDKAAAERLSLETAFQSFTQVSAQLADSYQHLQDHVSELQKELVESNKEKLRASIDRQHIATRLEHLLTLLPGGVVVLDSQGIVQQCNPVAEDFLGPALLGMQWTQIIERNFSPQFDDGHEISLKDGRRLSIATRSMTGAGLPGGCGQLILLTDQTETRELQAQLGRQDRLATMGKMVAYLAHQIRTPLSSAMLYAGHLQNESLPAKQKVPFAEKLVRQLKNVEQQISDLLIFARGSQATEQDMGVSDLMIRLEREVATTPTLESVTVTYVNNAEDVSLTCNPSALISAILNLINNAREANLETGHVSKLKVTIAASIVCHQLCLKIEDNGPGISKGDIGRVLEPFYSTRAKGTGLGLAVVQAVAKSLGGDLRLSASDTGGLKVELTIPVSIKQQKKRKF
ncbi:MAG: two-component system sensor histidine kinase FlrB [Candidatus Azotimanducaceae bacterium]